MGVLTTVDVKEGTCFGPLPVGLLIADPAYLIGQTTADILPELPTIRVDPCRLAEPARLIEWICNLRNARCPREQNVELVTLKMIIESSGLLLTPNDLGRSREASWAVSQPSTVLYFYRTLRHIKVGEELLVWFRRETLNPLLLEFMQSADFREAWTQPYDIRSTFESFVGEDGNRLNASFHCPTCRTGFSYIYPFVCHCLFKGCGGIQEFTASGKSLAAYCLLKTIERKADSLLASHGSLEVHPSAPVFLQKPIFLQGPMTQTVSSEGLSTSELAVGNEADLEPRKTLIYPENRPKVTSTTNTSATTPLSKEQVPRRKLPSYLTGIQHAFQPRTVSRPLEPNSALLKTRNPLVDELIRMARCGSPQHDPDVKIGAGSVNRQVEVKLASSLTAMAQNWCAGCSVSFRLTSDLVHHMRVHHSKCQPRGSLGLTNSVDRSHRVGYRRRREKAQPPWENILVKTTPECKKLTKSSVCWSDSDVGGLVCQESEFVCHLCCEVFQERHHLSRHLTSHDP